MSEYTGGGKNLLEEMEKAENLLGRIIEGSYDGIYITDGEANTLMVNGSYERISGLRREQVLGKNMRALVEEGLISMSGTLKAIEMRRSATLEQEFQTGKRAIITSTPMLDDDGEVVMVVTNVRDVTDLYEMKRQLKETEKNTSELEAIRREIIGDGEMVAADPAMLQVMQMVDKVSGLDTTVLLTGETGVGKDKIASYIYRHSSRANKRFIKVNCGALPPAQIETELFGQERSAFAGAGLESKMGLFEVADKGTLFLNEVGELPMDMQVKLLRVLQDQEFERIGSTRPIKVDVRIIAASNRNLEEMLREKTFREDLYYRLSVFPVHVPPLRERAEDILPLAQRFLEELNSKYAMNKSLMPAGQKVLLDYSWPGNVRELQNVVERAMIMSNSGEITARDLLPHVASAGGPGQEMDLKAFVEQVELDSINQAYRQWGNVRAAARSLGMDASTFVRKRKKYSEKYGLLRS